MQQDHRKTSYLADSASLREWCGNQDHPTAIGFDTEFLRVKTYYPKACLFQVATESSISLIDVLTIDDLTPILDWLFDSSVQIIMHAAGQDLELLHNLSGKLPNNMFDTQIAHSFLNEDGQLGYAGLVEHLVAVSLEKSQSRYDWSKRPLSPAQLEYAADDVRYLHKMHQLQTSDLQARNLYDWFSEDCVGLEKLTFQASASNLLSRIKGKRDLDREDLAVLQDLALWREQVAIQKNLPRKWVVGDELLLALAQTKPTTNDQLAQIPELSDKLRNRYAATFFEIVSNALNSPPDSWPDPQLRNTPEQRALLRKLQQEVKKIAAQLELSPSLIASRKGLESLMHGDPNSPLTTGWREQETSQQLLALID